MITEEKNSSLNLSVFEKNCSHKYHERRIRAAGSLVQLYFFFFLNSESLLFKNTLKQVFCFKDCF